MIGADLARTASQGLLAALVITGHANLAWFVVLQSVHGAASALFNPAIVGIMPELATAETLQQGNSIRGIGGAMGNLAGPALAGVLVVLVGRGWALAADAATFAASATCLLAIRAGRRRPVSQANVAEDQARAQSAWRDLREGWTQFRSRAWVWSIVISAATQNLLYSSFFILGPVQAQQHYHGVRGWALILTCAGAGSVAGGVISLRLRPAHPLATGCLFLATLGLPALALGLGLPLAAVAAAYNSWWETALQQHIPLKVLSRVSAYDSTASFASIPLGLAIAAPIAAIAGTTNVLIAAGAIQLLAGLAPLAVPDVRHLTQQTEPTPPSNGNLPGAESDR
jgi:MFS family permease